MNQPLSEPAASSGGIFFILIAATGFGLLPILTRAADAVGISLETMLVMRFIGPAIIFLPWIRQLSGSPKSAFELFIAGLFIGAGAFGYLNALVELEVATAALIFFTFPLFTIVFGMLIARTKPSFRETAAVAIILAATALILQPQSLAAGSLTTILLAFATPAAYGFLILTLSRSATQFGARARSAPVAVGALCGAMPLFLMSGISPEMTMNGETIMVLAAQLTVAGIIPQVALVIGTRNTGATLAAIAATSELVVALVSGWTVLGEPIRATSVVGAAMVMSAIVLATTSKR